MALHTIVEHDTTHIKPYIDKVKQALSDEVATRAALGAHNLLPYTLESLKAINLGGTWSGNVFTPTSQPNVHFTVNSDLSITATTDGALTGLAILYLVNTYSSFSLTNCILSGCPAGGSTTTYYMPVIEDAFWATGDIGNSYSSVGTITTVAIALDVSTPTGLNKTFYPLLRDKSDSSTKFTPYAMTNMELTDALANAKCVVDADGIVSVNADGTKTYSQLLDSLTTAFLTKLSSLPTGHYIVVDTIILGGLSTYRVENKVIFTNNTSSFALYGIYVSADNSNIITNFLLYSSTSGNSAVRYALTNVSTGTSITNKISDVPTNDKLLIINFTEYKSV